MLSDVKNVSKSRFIIKREFKFDSNVESSSSDWYYNQVCQITIPQRDYNECPALILRSDPRVPRFLHPESYSPRTIRIQPGESGVRIQCPYPDYLIVGSTGQQLRSAVLMCDRGVLRLSDTSNVRFLH